MRSLIILTIAVFMLASCKKEAGYGGKATIKGEITVISQDNNGTENDRFPAMDHDMFIIYGESDTQIDDDIKTSFDGTFQFEHLYPGKYKLFTYSDHPGEFQLLYPRDSVIEIDVEITDKDEIVDLGEIFIVRIQ